MLLLIGNHTFAQNCPDFDIELLTQEDVDNFCQSFPDCTEVTGDLIIGSSSSVNYSDVNDLSCLSSLNFVEGDLIIRNTSDLSNLNGFQNLQEVNKLSLHGNHSLTTLNSLSNLNDTIQSIYLSNNNQLQNLEGLNNIKAIVASLQILSNDGLENINAFENAVFDLDYLIIKFNLVLKSLQPIAYANVKKRFEVNYNYQLESIDDFVNISVIEERLFIKNNPELQSIGSFSNLRKTGNFNIDFNENILELRGFEKLDTISGYLSIRDNLELNSINGFQNLKSISGYLNISNNNALTEINGCGNISYIGDFLSILYNENLSDISGFSTTVIDMADLLIYNNPILGNCAIESICNFIENGCFINVYNNAAGCNSVDEVLENCQSVSTPVIDEVSITISPNPATHYFTLTSNQSIDETTIKAVDVNGRQWLPKTKLQGKNYNISHWPSGIYYVTIETENGQFTQKLIKR